MGGFFDTLFNLFSPKLENIGNEQTQIQDAYNKTWTYTHQEETALQYYLNEQKEVRTTVAPYVVTMPSVVVRSPQAAVSGEFNPTLSELAKMTSEMDGEISQGAQGTEWTKSNQAEAAQTGAPDYTKWIVLGVLIIGGIIAVGWAFR